MKCPHCKAHIDKHEPTRCLDAWVAEKVMGWSGSYGDYVWIMLPPKGSTGRAENRSYPVPKYSTSIEAAWEVVEKLNSSGHVVEIINDCVAWSVRFMNIDTDKKYTSDWKCSLETQICRTAIKAVS